MNAANSNERAVWGVLGGMGPLASAEFLRTIYEQAVYPVEQQAPIVFLISDPTIPDRTHALLNGQQDELFRHFACRMEQLISLGVTGVVVCCVTIHPLLPRLPLAARKKVISLVDVIFEAVLRSSQRHLLLGTQATNQLGIFQEHRHWQLAKEKIAVLAPQDQQRFHELIYQVKAGQNSAADVLSIEQLLRKYEVESYIAGCTEVHLIAKYQEKISGRPRNQFCIDPLTIIASMMASTACVAQAC